LNQSFNSDGKLVAKVDDNISYYYSRLPSLPDTSSFLETVSEKYVTLREFLIENVQTKFEQVKASVSLMKGQVSDKFTEYKPVVLESILPRFQEIYCESVRLFLSNFTKFFYFVEDKYNEVSLYAKEMKEKKSELLNTVRESSVTVFSNMKTQFTSSSMFKTLEDYQSTYSTLIADKSKKITSYPLFQRTVAFITNFTMQ
jgi:gas vesicle protein